MKDPCPGFIYLFKFGHDFDLKINFFEIIKSNEYENDRRADFCFLSMLDSGKMINGKLGGQVSQKE